MRRPDDTIAHHLDSRDLRPGQLGLEFDYRLMWLRDTSGDEYAVMTNTVDTAGHVLGPRKTALSPLPLILPLYKRSTTATLAVFDLARGRVHQRCTEGEVDAGYGFTRLSGADSWRIARDSDGATTRIQAGGLEVDLRATENRPRTFFSDRPQEQAGIIDNGVLGPAAYVIQTDLDVGGTLRLDDRTLGVKGSGWIDRQWMESDLLKRPPVPFAWRWFAIALEGRGEMLVYEMWNPLTARDIKRYAAISGCDGTLRVLEPDSFSIRCGGRRGHGADAYDTEWDLRFAALDLSLHLQAKAEEPWIETRTRDVRHRFLESPCEVQAATNTVTGRAWAEQVSTLWIKPAVGLDRLVDEGRSLYERWLRPS